ncbi:hypothetical protein [Tahibacter caeni]|uniref:hypothetical protein n=1 Tax=Tahibacter caeni TaxID=1453545 RepID=UPI002149554D|nr:hypothetical protein [Tahibacter caeni]
MASSNFTRGDLHRQDYEWSAQHGDDPASRLWPDDVLFDRNQGYEVLSLLNRFAFGKPDERAYFLAGEEWLRDLPGNIRARRNVLAWLEERARFRPIFKGGALNQIR